MVYSSGNGTVCMLATVRLYYKDPNPTLAPPYFIRCNFFSDNDVGGQAYSNNACYKKPSLLWSLLFQMEFAVRLDAAALAPNLR